MGDIENLTASYTLDPQENRRLTRAYQKRAGFAKAPWFYGLIALSQLGNLLNVLIDTRMDFTIRVLYICGIMTVVVVGAIYAFITVRNRARRTFTIELTPSGMTGTFNAQMFAVNWQQVRSVVDLGEAFAIESARIKQPSPHFVPKRAMADPTAWWRTFDDKLTGKRGLIRRGTPTTIANTAR